jgi:hypothetical protein
MSKYGFNWLTAVRKATGDRAATFAIWRIPDAPTDQEWTVGVEVHQKPGLMTHPLKTFSTQDQAIALLDRIMSGGAKPQ